MNKRSKVLCKETCHSAGGAMFFANVIYNCDVLGHTYFIEDKDGDILRLEDNHVYKQINLHTFFYTEKEIRKLKINKINNVNK